MRNYNQHSPNARIPSILGGNILGSAATSPACHQGRSSRAIYASFGTPKACRKRSWRTVQTLTATMLDCLKASNMQQQSICSTSWPMHLAFRLMNFSVARRKSSVLPISEIVRYFDKTAYRGDGQTHSAVRKSGINALKTGMNYIMYRSGNRAKHNFDSFGGHTL